MMMRVVFAGAAFALAGPTAAASLLTSEVGYSGPALDLSAYAGLFIETNGPVVLPGGITFTSQPGSPSVLAGIPYGLGGNGIILNRTYMATNDASFAITLTFATEVASFGAEMSYIVNGTGIPGGDDPVISAFDGNGNLIASYNLFQLAPIFTPGGVDAFMFRGIDGGGIGIKSFTMAGAGILAAGTLANAVPEPSSWAMLIAGFGLVGATLRRRRALLA